jgi:hypothetical protein
MNRENEPTDDRVKWELVAAHAQALLDIANCALEILATEAAS